MNFAKPKNSTFTLLETLVVGSYTVNTVFFGLTDYSGKIGKIVFAYPIQGNI